MMWPANDWPGAKTEFIEWLNHLHMYDNVFGYKDGSNPLVPNNHVTDVHRMTSMTDNDESIYYIVFSDGKKTNMTETVLKGLLSSMVPSELNRTLQTCMWCNESFQTKTELEQHEDSCF